MCEWIVKMILNYEVLALFKESNGVNLIPGLYSDNIGT